MKKKSKKVNEKLKADIKTLEYDFKTNNSNNELEFKKIKSGEQQFEKKSFNNFYKFHIQMIYSVFVNLQN